MTKIFKTAFIFAMICCVTICSIGSAGCSGEKNNSSPQTSEDSGKKEGHEEIIEDTEAHYLQFRFGNDVIAEILVTENDTYESLEPYFPVLPKEEGYIIYWERVDNVYVKDQLKVIINANRAVDDLSK